MNNQKNFENTNEIQSNKILKLFLGILFDFIGMLSYVFPGIGETFDIIWAPISGFILMKMYKGTVGKIGGVIETVEELLPFTDIIPTFTLTWIYVYLIKKDT